MAPAGRTREPSIDHSPVYEEFMTTLREYHEKRGTPFEPAPRVGNRHIDLLKLYNAVTERGGYDAVCSEKLAWRKLSQEFNLGTSNLPSVAFGIKSTYYKTLVAYEISTFHGKEPPPKEILEDISARGGDVLNRTLENFKPRGSREQGGLANGDDSDGSGLEGQHTPKDERAEPEDPSSAGRATRGLRQAPPQRVLFQPDLSSTRQPRQSSANMNSPQPSGPVVGNAASNLVESRFFQNAIANYEPSAQVPLSVRPVPTPANNPSLFREREKSLKEARAAQHARSAQSNKGLLVPGTGFMGPNIYIRTLQALRSGVPEEQDFALHHLVRVSHERGDRFKFETFQGLAEGLIDVILDVGSLFYDVDWQVSLWNDKTSEGHILNGLHATSDILERIRSLTPLAPVDVVQTEDFDRRMTKITEASLVLRNMAMLESNARYLAGIPSIRDCLVIALNLPRRDTVTEVRHYALDIAEQLTKYFCVDSEDPLYHSLLLQVESDDRGAILTSLQAISRISMNLEENNRLKGVPVATISKICALTLLNDEELTHACLDFLYQYTAVADNVELMIEQMAVDGFVNQLVRLLMYGAREVRSQQQTKAAEKAPVPDDVADLPPDLLEQLLQFREPERCTRWLRSCFQEDPNEELTQITLWQTYSRHFSGAAVNTTPLLAAADFIKNISNTFSGAAAQVVQPEGVPKFIIRGIRPRSAPVNAQGKAYHRCLWQTAPYQTCDRFVLEPKAMYEHILADHLQVPKLENGAFDSSVPRSYNCHWGDCRKFSSTSTSSAHEFAVHIRTHLPDDSSPQTTEGSRQAEYVTRVFYNTAVDERGDAAGLPLTAALVLRNLARHLPKGEGDSGWLQKLFGPVEKQLWVVMANNKPLSRYMADLMEALATR
ncbi:MAG: Chromatin structure-remodeling complex protein rsc9 [Piccolia ochrophora]|nr:MAG: Chromatin structure-remodeling complex protein rsc9 [Piccolia ochrophora]